MIIVRVVIAIHYSRDYGTRDASFEAFATNLFNAWEIGDEAKNNGVMIWKRDIFAGTIDGGAFRSVESNTAVKERATARLWFNKTTWRWGGGFTTTTVAFLPPFFWGGYMFRLPSENFLP